MRKPPLANQTSKKLALALFGLMLFFNVFIMPSLAGDKALMPLDLLFAYTPERAYELMDTYSGDSRQAYIVGEMTKDLAYPIVYTLFMSVSLMLLFPGKWKLAWLPYTIFFFDIMENTGIVTLLLNYPKQLTTVAWCTSIFSSIKWILVLIVIVTILLGLGKNLIARK